MDINTPQKFRTLVADPPWKISGGKNGRGGWSKSASPDFHYPLMSMAEIACLPISKLAEDDSHLWLWVPNCLMPDGLRTMSAWGYRYITNIVWVKTGAPGLGQYIRTMHEMLLFGVKGKIPYARDANGKRQQIRSTITAPRGRHSAKPPEVRGLIERVSPGPYLELFCRGTSAPGWATWGNEAKNPIEMPITTEITL